MQRASPHTVRLGLGLKSELGLNYDSLRITQGLTEFAGTDVGILSTETRVNSMGFGTFEGGPCFQNGLMVNFQAFLGGRFSRGEYILVCQRR